MSADLAKSFLAEHHARSDSPVAAVRDESRALSAAQRMMVIGTIALLLCVRLRMGWSEYFLCGPENPDMKAPFYKIRYLGIPVWHHVPNPGGYCCGIK